MEFSMDPRGTCYENFLRPTRYYYLKHVPNITQNSTQLKTQQVHHLLKTVVRRVFPSVIISHVVKTVNSSTTMVKRGRTTTAADSNRGSNIPRGEEVVFNQEVVQEEEEEDKHDQVTYILDNNFDGLCEFILKLLNVCDNRLCVELGLQDLFMQRAGLIYQLWIQYREHCLKVIEMEAGRIVCNNENEKIFTISRAHFSEAISEAIREGDLVEYGGLYRDL